MQPESVQIEYAIKDFNRFCSGNRECGSFAARICIFPRVPPNGNGARAGFEAVVQAKRIKKCIAGAVVNPSKFTLHRGNGRAGEKEIKINILEDALKNACAPDFGRE